MSEDELYEWVNDRLPASVDRRSARQDWDAGEPWVAVWTLLEEAEKVGELTAEILTKVREVYPEGNQRLIIDAIASSAA